MVSDDSDVAFMSSPEGKSHAIMMNREDILSSPDFMDHKRKENLLMFYSEYSCLSEFSEWILRMEQKIQDVSCSCDTGSSVSSSSTSINTTSTNVLSVSFIFMYHDDYFIRKSTDIHSGTAIRNSKYGEHVFDCNQIDDI